MRTLSILLCGMCAATLLAQGQAAQNQAAPAASPQPPAASAAKSPQGIAPVWDVKATLVEVASHAERLLPVLDQIDSKEWLARGASETYIEQLQSCKVQCKAIADTAKDLARQPERLSAALELYFRLHTLDTMLTSLQEGIRRYLNPAVADMLAAVAAEKSDKRQGFERFLVELAATREQQLLVMDAEAQRCRGNLSRQTPNIPQPCVTRTPATKKSTGRKK
jgi:hypothetical protein